MLIERVEDRLTLVEGFTGLVFVREYWLKHFWNDGMETHEKLRKAIGLKERRGSKAI
ncbi:hypothetical protein SANA_06080 [Gottschalkiaceae bacterium SANA]|nr:hypothetical protein SANA_06080 [Gottschalkiaceae bacterium SANA]